MPATPPEADTGSYPLPGYITVAILDTWLTANKARPARGESQPPPSQAVQECMKQLNLQPPDFLPAPPEPSQARVASAAGDLDTLREILDGWQGNPDGFGYSIFSTSLTPALEGGHTAAAVTSCLLEYGVTPEAVHFKFAMDYRAFPVLDLYLRYGYNIDDGDFPFQPTALANALDDEEMTRWLLERGADPNAEGTRNSGKMGRTRLSVSMGHTPFNRIRMLFDYGGPDSIPHGFLLWYATRRKVPDRIQVLEYLLHQGAAGDLTRIMLDDRPEAAMKADWGAGRGTPLHTPARVGKLDAVKLFIAWGADPSIRDSKGQLAVERARETQKFKANGGTAEEGAPDGDKHEAIIECLTSLSERRKSLLVSSPKGIERL